MSDLVYSIVVPIFNEQQSLPELFARLRSLMGELDGHAEVIMVDDGSTDASYSMMREISGSDQRFKLIRLSRNFGHQIAITAGLDVASGQAVIIIDADLQDPPELILEMVAKWRSGYEVVYALRAERTGESVFKRLTAAAFYRTLQRLTDIEAPLDVGDFRLVDRRALEAFRAMRENNRYVRGMFSWIGFRQAGVTYSRAPRFAGSTKFSLRRMMQFAIDGIVSFSNVPLRLALNLGFFLAALSFLVGIASITAKLTGAFVVPGWASLIVAVCFLGGIQLMILGVMGEYIARIYDEVKNRPLYLVMETRGFERSARFEPRRMIASSTPAPHGEGLWVDEMPTVPPS
jgi:polyisoprenyl-phosphate glycosyltransferase